MVPSDCGYAARFGREERAITEKAHLCCFSLPPRNRTEALILLQRLPVVLGVIPVCCFARFELTSKSSKRAGRAWCSDARRRCRAARLTAVARPVQRMKAGRRGAVVLYRQRFGGTAPIVLCSVQWPAGPKADRCASWLVPRRGAAPRSRRFVAVSRCAEDDSGSKPVRE